MHPRSQQWGSELFPDTLLLESCDTVIGPDLLSLRHDQQLEHAKEYNSILAEPLGSRMKSRRQSSRSGQAGDDINKRPAWVNPGRCAAHPWRPLQWDHVSQAQLIAFEASLRGTPPSPQPAEPQPSQPCRMVAWEDGEQSAAGARQTPPYHGQQQQQDLLLPELWAATQDSCAAVHKHARAAHGDTDHAAISRHEAARAFDSHRSCSPTVHHSTQGYTAQHRPRQVNGAACSPTCQHACAPKPMQRPARDCLKHDSNVGQHIADGSCLHSRTQRTPDMTEVQKGNKTSRRKVCMSPSPERVSKPCTPGKPRPNQAAGGSKVQSSGAAGYRARSSSGHGNVAQAQGSSQQGSQRKRGLSAGPTHMKNWVQWESHQDKAELSPGAKLAVMASPLHVMTQETNQAAGCSQPAARDQISAGSRRHVMPCSGHRPPAQLPEASQGVPTRPVQPLFSSPQGRTVSVSPEGGFDRGVSLGSGSSSRVAGVRYCLSSSEPAVGAGVWEEQITRSWLREARLGVTSADEAAPLLQNPLRNGVLLCDLAGALEGRIVWGVNRKPRSLAAARSNVFAALGHLGMLTAQTCPRGLLHEVEHILQGRQASIWGMLNHMRLTHPSALVIASQPAEQQPVDRTLTSSDEEACKPDRCLGAVAAATSTTVTHDCGNHAQDRVSVGPHGTIRCTSPVQRIPRQQPQHQQQQPRKAQTGLSACPYHDHETMTISLVGQANMYGSPARAVSPQRSHRHASPTQGRGDAERSSANDAYVRLVDVRPALGRQQQHGKVQFADRSGASQHQQTAPPRCPEPAAAEAAASSSNRRAALAQLRMSRRRQQQLLPADVEQRISEKMCARKKQGHGADWSSRKTQDRRQLFLSDSELVEWARSKGLKELLPGMLLEETFADGRLLCRLVGLLERNTLSGIEWRTPSVAASCHNVTKAMSELKKRPTMSLQNLWRAADIVKAEPGLVQALLNDVVRAYT